MQIVDGGFVIAAGKGLAGQQIQEVGILPSVFFDPAPVLSSQFDAALRDDKDMQAKVFRAIIDVMAGKLSNDNVRLRDHHMEKSRAEGRLAVLERKLEEQRHRTAIAVEMAAESGGLSADEVEMRIAEKVKDLVPRLLVVDDEADFRGLVRDALPSLEVVEAENGRQGLEKLNSDSDVELIVSDIEMPEMDGVEFIRNVRASDEFSFLPILVMTTLGQIKQRDDALNAGADAFIQKPVTLEALQTILEDVW